MNVRKVQLAYDGAVVAEVAETPVDALAGVFTKATNGARAMAAMTRHERAEILFRASRRLAERKEEFARTITLESGKPIREARLEVDRGAATLWASGEEAHRLAGEEVPLDAGPNGAGHVGLTLRQPLGVIAAITPFNFPLNLGLHKVGPALAAGNAVVQKPASATPLSALHVAALLLECGLPAEALQVVVGPGTELGAALVAAPEVRMVSFTGSLAVGERLQAAAGMKRVTLELGNNSAVVVCADADLEAAVAACVAGGYANSGQTCISVQRVLVERPVYEDFLERFAKAVAALRLAHPLEDNCDISCLIDEREAQRVQAWVGEAVREGAVLRQGGGRNQAILQPTVLAQAPVTSRVMREEVFGPVVCVNAFDDLGEAIRIVNDSRYGLQTGVFTESVRQAWRCAREIESGSVLINDSSSFRVDLMPYGGWKQSGMGKEGPRYAMEQMTESKLVSWRLD
jgi:acyl-CoA reductase-like NAD-dependent aldehyde dehydrogenase